MVKLVNGVGVNDVDYVTQKYGYETVDGKEVRKQIWICPYYKRWRGMLERCHSEKLRVRRPTYKDCTICDDWLHFTGFIKWVDSQPNRCWQNCSLDKDFLVEGNKHYAPSTCVFITKEVNNFITDSGAKRGDYLIGVSWNKEMGKFVAQCNDPFKTKSRYIGYFELEIDAHNAWKARKHEYACKLADLQSDERVAGVLRTRYSGSTNYGNSILSC